MVLVDDAEAIEAGGGMLWASSEDQRGQKLAEEHGLLDELDFSSLVLPVRRLSQLCHRLFFMVSLVKYLFDRSH